MTVSEKIMRVLIADDEREIAKQLAVYVKECNHEVVGIAAQGGLEVIQLFNKLQPDVVIMDILMPRLNGFTVARTLASKQSRCKVILCSGKITADYPNIGQCDAAAFLTKPFQFEQVRQALETVESQLAIT